MPYINLKVKGVKKGKHTRRMVLAVMAAGLLGLLLFFGARNFTGREMVKPETSVLSLTTENERIGGNDSDPKSLGILLLGYGGAGHSGGFLADAIQIVYVDFETSKINLISVPRDLWVKFPDGRESKINAASVKLAGSPDKFKGDGGTRLKTFFGDLFGMKIDYLVGIDFIGFQRAVGLNLKTLDVRVAEPLNDPWYPTAGKELDDCGLSPEKIAEISGKFTGFELERQFACRYEQLDFKPGTVKMEAGTALKYARSRHGSGAGDMSRNKRQQEILAAIKDKMLDLGFIGGLPGFYADIKNDISTDIDLGIIELMAPAVKNASAFRLNNINLSTENVLAAGTEGGASVIKAKAGKSDFSGIREFIAGKVMEK